MIMDIIILISCGAFLLLIIFGLLRGNGVPNPEHIQKILDQKQEIELRKQRGH